VWTAGKTKSWGANGGRVYLQGTFVKCDPTADDHNHLEIHPLDSVAYAKDVAGNVIAARPSETAWPDRTVVWRVGVVSNAGFHRINSCGFVRRRRTTVWYLTLPAQSSLPTMSISVDQNDPGFWHSPTNQRFTRRGVVNVAVDPPAYGQPHGIASFPIDPVDGRNKLRVEVTMERPDDWGGLFLRDFTIRARPPVVDREYIVAALPIRADARRPGPGRTDGGCASWSTSTASLIGPVPDAVPAAADARVSAGGWLRLRWPVVQRG
jgi:hypothetical protein